jgi:hypothetical protein
MTDTEKPEPAYARFDDDAGLQQAIDRLLVQPGRELRIFDPDFSTLRPNLPARVDTLLKFLQASRTRRIYIAVHNTDYLSRHAPRLLGLYARYTHAIAIHRTNDGIHEIKDSFMVLDSTHYVRRAVARYYRGAIGLNDELEAYAMRSRFMEIWGASHPAPMLKTLGL